MLTDEEVFALINDGSEESRELIYKNYEYIFDIYMKKYNKYFYAYLIELQDAKAECLYAFNQAICCYNLDKNSSFASFLSMCVDRRLLKIIRYASTTKNKLKNASFSLDYVYNEYGSTLKEMINNDKDDPVVILQNKEKDRFIEKKIKKNLSDLELKVYDMMLDNYDYEKIARIVNKDKKVVYNTIHRVKQKIKEILEEEKNVTN